MELFRQAPPYGHPSLEAFIRAHYPKLESSHATFIHLEPLDQLVARCRELEQVAAAERGELWGVPFAAKDNVDAKGIPTTAACPSFSYTPQASAPALQALLEAGAILVGKTNMDQFAAGLVGTRSPYGVPLNSVDSRFVPGGSSSGSATAVTSGLVSFALGTDTAGSGRVPAGLNGCVGVKGTVGLISTVGVVPACASLDCLTVFASTVEDGARVMRIMAKADVGPKDVWRRKSPAGNLDLPPETGFKFAVPSREFLDWSSPGAKSLVVTYQAEFDRAVDRLLSMGGVQVEINFGPLVDTAALLYGSSFVAERFSGIRKFLEGSEVDEQAESLVNDKRLMPVTRHVIAGASKFTAVDVYDDLVRLAALRAQSSHELGKVDMVLVPTALAHFTVDEVNAEENGATPKWTRNAKLGRFTNFVNLLNMCGISVPSSVISYDLVAVTSSSDGSIDAEEKERARRLLEASPEETAATLPFGVTLLTDRWRDEWVWGVAKRFQDRGNSKQS